MSEEPRRAEATAEESVIGSMLLDPRCVGDVLSRLRASDFRAGRLRSIFEVIRSLYNEQTPIDHVVVVGRLGDEYWEAVTTCMELTPTAVNVEHYCQIVRDRAELDRLKRMAERLQDVTDLQEARQLVAQAQAAAADRPGVTTMTLAEMMAGFFKRLAGPKPEYLPWGLGMLDDMLQTGPGKYVIIGARPSTGKTALALQLALNIAKKKRVGFFSLETIPEVLADRIGAAKTSLTLPTIKKHTVTPSDLQVVGDQIGMHPDLRGDFEVVSAASLTVDEIRTITLARRFEVVFIDYVQLIQSTARGERTEQMQRVSMELRAMAQLTGVVIVALAQLRRPDTQQKQKTATMADLKESGQFEQDADSILLMYHQDPQNRTSDRMIKIEKNKEGYAGFVARYRFDGKKQTFSPVDKDGEPLRAEFQEIEDDGQEELPFS